MNEAHTVILAVNRCTFSSTSGRLQEALNCRGFGANGVGHVETYQRLLAFARKVRRGRTLCLDHGLAFACLAEHKFIACRLLTKKEVSAILA